MMFNDHRLALRYLRERLNRIGATLADGPDPLFHHQTPEAYAARWPAGPVSISVSGPTESDGATWKPVAKVGPDWPDMQGRQRRLFVEAAHESANRIVRIDLLRKFYKHCVDKIDVAEECLLGLGRTFEWAAAQADIPQTIHDVIDADIHAFVSSGRTLMTDCIVLWAWRLDREIANAWVDPWQLEPGALLEVVSNRYSLQAVEEELFRNNPSLREEEITFAEDWEETYSEYNGDMPAIVDDLAFGVIKVLASLVESFAGIIDVTLGIGPLTPIFVGDDEKDRPLTEQDMVAKSFWQSGDLWLGTFKRFQDQKGKGRSARGDGEYAQMIRATVGEDAKAHSAEILRFDARICEIKYRARIRDFYLAPPKNPDYSAALTTDHLRLLYNGVAFGNRCGLVLNARITISWFMVLGHSAADYAAFFVKFKKNMAQWLADNRPSSVTDAWPAYVFAHEVSNGTRYHTHIRVAVPPDLAEGFRKWVRAALAKIIAPAPWPDAEEKKGTFVEVRVDKIKEHSADQLYDTTRYQWVRLLYCLKGIDPRPVLAKRPDGTEVRQADIVCWEYEDPGEPWAGKRAGTSEAIGSKRQADWRSPSGEPFVSLLDWQISNGLIDVRELYSDWYLDLAAGRKLAPTPPMPESPSKTSPDNDLSTLTKFWNG